MRWEGDVLALLDQTELPEAERVLRLRTAGEVAEAIARMRVRGAPAVGLAGAYGVALESLRAQERGEDPVAAALRAAQQLRSVRPTAVNLSAAVDAMAELARAGAAPGRLVAEAQALHQRDLERSKRLIEHGVKLLRTGSRCLTHCHTGPLATGGGGTALGVLLEGHRRGLVAEVLVGETRPRLQGARLTALELGRAGVPYAIVADGASSSLIAAGRVDQVWIGADRVARNGDVANKVGSLGLGLACADGAVPFHVAFPWTTFDAALARGGDAEIEWRDSSEVLELAGRRVAAAGAQALNPAFDVTPARLVTAWITDVGVARSADELERFSGTATPRLEPASSPAAGRRTRG
jgi:methylthioribose-1-phosphate isomerase